MCSTFSAFGSAVTMWSGSLQSEFTAIRKQQNPNSLFDFCECICEWACVWCVYVAAHISAHRRVWKQQPGSHPESCVYERLCVSTAKVASIFAHLTYVEPYIVYNIYTHAWEGWEGGRCGDAHLQCTCVWFMFMWSVVGVYIKWRYMRLWCV